MPTNPVESTITYSATPTGGSQVGLALRWVHPEPKRPPVWLDRPLVFGRDANSDVVLNSSQVSRKHAEIKAWGPLSLLNDLDSKNGVQVNGARVKSHALQAGDVVRIGDVLAVIVEARVGSDLSFRCFHEGLFGGYRHALALEQLRELSRTNLSVLLEGATGTGKERFAELLHALSGRPGPLVTVNCAAYSGNVAAGELFGYRRGAFTGAERPNPGHVRAAQGGTLFLDELPELPAEVQPMLLRTLENREVLPLGEVRAEKVDVRFVAASQFPLANAVANGRFRADLRARIEGGVICLPRLEACREIVPELFAMLYERHTGYLPQLTPGFVEALCLRDFSLNVRELETLARRISVRAAHALPLQAEAIQHFGSEPPVAARGAAVEQDGPSRTLFKIPGRAPGPYPEQELQLLSAALQRANGNLTQAAAALGISRQRAYRMLEHLNEP